MLNLIFSYYTSVCVLSDQTKVLNHTYDQAELNDSVPCWISHLGRRLIRVLSSSFKAVLHNIYIWIWTVRYFFFTVGSGGFLHNWCLLLCIWDKWIYCSKKKKKERFAYKRFPSRTRSLPWMKMFHCPNPMVVSTEIIYATFHFFCIGYKLRCRFHT